jgi:hypothetical protein
MTGPTKATPRAITVSGTLLGIGLALAMPISPVAFGGATMVGDRDYRHSGLAHIARTLNVTDEAHLHYIHNSGSQLIETGAATGTLPGSMNAHVSVGASISGTFTIIVHGGGGSIKGHGTATPSGSGTYESFRGTLTATGGTGRYTHAHGHAKLYGTFNRKTYAMVVQTTGRLSY